MIAELDLGGFSLAETKKYEQNKLNATHPPHDATHPLNSPVVSLHESCGVVVLLGKSNRIGTVGFLSLFSSLYSLFRSTQRCSLSTHMKSGCS